MTKMRKLFYCVVVLNVVLAIASCQENKQANIVFERVEGMMDDYPDSALAILDSMRKESESYPRSQKMKYELLCAKAQNKAYVDFTTDSVMKEVVDYYDAHGTANEKVEAHYLLGCVYRDLHESPAALNCYYDAVECADTLSDDCDYGMLMRVYGQMADEFDREIMPYKEIEALKNMQEYALKSNDTISYFISLQNEAHAYSFTNDTIKQIDCLSKVYSYFYEKRMFSKAARSIPNLILLYINNNNIAKAKELMDIFEQESGLFDNKGNIASMHSHYYNTKALYYQKIGILDSSDFYYRKLIACGYDYDGYKGLVQIYTESNALDSVILYSRMKEKAFAASYTNLHTQAMFNADGMYNYARNQRLAEQNFRLAYRNRNIIYVMTIVIIIVSAVSFSIYCHYKSKKKIELEALNMNFLKVSERYEAAKKDLVQMGEDYSGFRKAKAEELSALQQQLTQINSQYNSLKHKDKIDALKNSSAFQAIKNKLDPRQMNNLVSDSEWDELTLLVSQCLPAFYSRITNENQLSKQELQVTILTKLGFSSNDIALLLDKPAQRISNAKAASNLKLFGDNSARTLAVNVETL